MRRIHGQHGHEMKIKSEIGADSPTKSCHQLQDQGQYDQFSINCQWYGVQYMLQFMPGDYVYENLPMEMPKSSVVVL